jgi:hypothetical protein
LNTRNIPTPTTTNERPPPLSHPPPMGKLPRRHRRHRDVVMFCGPGQAAPPPSTQCREAQWSWASCPRRLRRRHDLVRSVVLGKLPPPSPLCRKAQWSWASYPAAVAAMS